MALISVGILNFSSGGSTIVFGSIALDHTKCGTADTTDVTLWVSISSNKLKTVANGGNVVNASGFDIVFTSDLLGVTLFSWQVLAWDGTAGTWQGWVRYSGTITHSVNTVFGINVGNSTYTTFQGGATGAAYNSAYNMWYHFNSSGTLITDATANAQTLTNVGATATSGQIGGGIALAGVSQYMFKNGPGITGGSAAMTMTSWFKMGANVAQEWFGVGTNAGTGVRIGCYYDGVGSLYAEASGIGVLFAWAYDTNWHRFTVTMPTGAAVSNTQIYLDGVLQTLTPLGTGTYSILPLQLSFGIIPQNTVVPFFNGSIDEARVRNDQVTAAREITEYNNEFNNATFLTLSL